MFYEGLISVGRTDSAIGCTQSIEGLRVEGATVAVGGGGRGRGVGCRWWKREEPGGGGGAMNERSIDI